MAVAEMCKLRLAGLTVEKNSILNALAETGAAEIKEFSLPSSLATEDGEDAAREIAERSARVETAIARLASAAENYAKGNKEDLSFLKDGFDVSYADFISAAEGESDALDICARVEEICAKSAAADGNTARANARLKSLGCYLPVKEKFSEFRDTRYARVAFGSVPADKLPEIENYVSGAEAVTVQSWEAVNGACAILFAAHKKVESEAFAVLSAAGFQRCPFTGDMSAADVEKECRAEIAENKRIKRENDAALFKLGKEIKKLKVLSDYYAFEAEKIAASGKMPRTKAAFLLEAYVPKDAENSVSSAINGVSEYTYFEFAPIEKDEMPPTLMKNNKVVRNFEFVTNMYTPPNYREFDPNAVMAVFFSIFMGFIMADVGYGILMTVGGFVMASRQKRDSGMKRLATVIGIGGIFTIIFGVLFGSFFGFSDMPFLPPALIKNINVMLAGSINLPLILLIALAMGIVQLMASNACRAYAEFREGRVIDGIFFGIIWVIFLGGLLAVVLGFTDEFGMGYLVLPGGITCGASLLIAAVTAGMHERGFGKFTKGFGAVYGIINYFSDILSYSRLYGLMLSGAIIAQIVAENAWSLLTSGNVAFIIIGAVVMIVGHAFNLAMGLLGAYIHDARLQYIEFFSRFYSGEGELFRPLGGEHKYIFVNNR